MALFQGTLLALTLRDIVWKILHTFVCLSVYIDIDMARYRCVLCVCMEREHVQVSLNYHLNYEIFTSVALNTHCHALISTSISRTLSG